MIKVHINKKETEIEEGLTVGELLKNLNNQKAAVWVNGKQLLKAEYGSRVIASGDELKILRIIAGG
jgi:thiamine biosynthesis protein ThiS